MSSQDARQLSFDFLPHLPVLVQPSEGQLSSDAGLLPLRQFDQRWNYTARMARCLFDPKPSREQSLLSMLRQRLFGILAGYEDCNDHDTLRDDPVFKLIADRLPQDKALASQPTLSRFENLATPPVLQKLIDFLIDTGIERLKQKHGGSLPAALTLDLDATDDPTHGHQQLTLFHGYFGQYQYFPLIISEPTSKHVFVAWLRPGTVHAALGADDDLMRVVNALRQERPDIQIHIRGDAGFGVPWMYELCEKNGLTYTFGFSTNARLKERTEGLMQRAVGQYESTQRKQRLFECFQYQAETWNHPRRLVAKAECHGQGTNLRFVITNLRAMPSPSGWPSDPVARLIYDDYIQRGESEHRMDELKNGLHMDRLSCHRFMANFFRLLLHTAAMNLLNAARDEPGVPEILRVGQPCTWRTHVIKVAAVIVQSTRRVLVKLAAQWPWWPMYRAVGRRSLNFSCGP
ncbi:MAG: IS1380 family transposase [Candidatus Sulfotelmatobacter sp.]